MEKQCMITTTKNIRIKGEKQYDKQITISSTVIKSKNTDGNIFKQREKR